MMECWIKMREFGAIEQSYSGSGGFHTIIYGIITRFKNSQIGKNLKGLIDRE